MANAAPAPEQYMPALERANEVRFARAELKLSIGVDPLSIIPLIMDPPRCIESAPVEEMLKAIPHIGDTRSYLLSMQSHCAFYLFRELNEVQRRALVKNVTRFIRRPAA